MTTQQKQAATEQYAAWRRQGVPSQVTAHEAWRLSGGRVGHEGDHSTPISLARVALATQRRD